MHPRQSRLSLSILVAVILIIIGLQYIMAIGVNVSCEPHIPFNLGEEMYISKPAFPQKINASDISIGGNLTYVYTLSNDSSYHIYFYGDWIGSKTDYDVYIYNPFGELESVHTEAAGLPEHLGTTVDEPYFSPKYSGNYSFLVVNDARESQDEKAATFMLIEHVECNTWFNRYLQGKINNVSVQNTSWSYEFVTSSRHIEVQIKVPETLDMYEARLYMMANPSKGMGTVLNGVPLAWEPGLYGERSGIYGGYNLDSRGFRNTDAMASCEFSGQDMLIDYTSPNSGDTLYHLVLIAENGTGTVDFMVKTDFDLPTISLCNATEKAYSGNETLVCAQVEDEKSSIIWVLMNYTTDNWETWYASQMSTSQNTTYIGTIPGQPAGSFVKYMVKASDSAENIATMNGEYVVKNPTNVTFTLSDSVVYGGENITVQGWIIPGGVSVRLNYTCTDTTISKLVSASSDGFFSDEYTPTEIGCWTVSAAWSGNETYYEVFSDLKNFTVQKAPTSIDFTISEAAITIGGEINISGSISPTLGNMKVELKFTTPEETVIQSDVYTTSDGTFSTTFKPDLVGSWSAEVKLTGDSLRQSATNESKSFAVNDTMINTFIAFIDQYKLYILVAIGVAASVSGVLIYLRRRE